MDTQAALLTVLYCTALLELAESTVAYRTLTVVNMCNEVVRVGRTGGRCMAQNFTVYLQTGCHSQMTPSPLDNYCYWDIPGFGNGTDLQPTESVSYSLPGFEFTCPDPKGGPDLNPATWSGNFWGATGCNRTEACETGICFYGPNDPRNGYCTAYQGPKGPVTAAEFTFQSNMDFYDVTTIGGVNVPVEMKPTGMTPATGMSGSSAYYWCGNAGGIMAGNTNLSDCSWMYNFTSISQGAMSADQSVFFTLVAKSANNTNCASDSDCPAGEVCGTLQDLDPFGGPGNQLFPGRCGRFIGLWTSDGICAWSSGFNVSTQFPNTEPLRCMTSAGQGSGTFSDLYQCAAQYGTSGYTDPSPGSCNVDAICGCPVWNNSGINAPATSPCQCDNPTWQSSSLPSLEPFKRACPTSYVYPFDDKSSIFTCNDGTPTNTQGYTITFCPGGTQISRAPTIAIDEGGSGVVVMNSSGVTVAMLALGLLVVSLFG